MYLALQPPTGSGVFSSADHSDDRPTLSTIFPMDVPW